MGSLPYGKVLRSAIGVLVTVVAVLVMGQLLPHFASVANLSNVLVQAALVAVAAFGMTLVLLTGGIDLSVGGVMSLVGVLEGVLISHGVPWLLAVVVGLALGALVGVVNGLVVARLGLPPFIATFGSLGIAAGLALFLADASPIGAMPDSFVSLGNDGFGKVPYLVVIALVLLVGLEVAVRVTPWGVFLRSSGNAPAVARTSGVPVVRTLTSAYLASGMLAAAAGTLLAANLSTAGPLQGEPYTLSAVAACVIGGVDLFGGRGHLWAAGVGTVFLAVLKNVLNLVGVEPFMQNLVLGCLIIVAVVATTRGPALRTGLVTWARARSAA